MTSTRSSRMKLLKCLLVLPVLLVSGRAHALEYLLDAPIWYEYGNCGGKGVPDWTGPLTDGLNAQGWTSTIFKGGAAWPQDFIDPVGGDADGIDYQAADANDLTIFSGHGNTGQLFFSVNHDGRCMAGFDDSLTSTNISMGADSGAQAANWIVIACCFLNLHQEGTYTNRHNVNQIMGFGGVSWLDTSMISKFWNGTGGSGTNLNSWLHNMEDKPGLFTGDNTTVVFTRGRDPNNRSWNRSNCGLKRQTCVTRTGGGYWSIDWMDHGCSGCNRC